MHSLSSRILTHWRAEFRFAQVAFREPPRDTYDGLRGFEIKDADGYLLFFAVLGDERSFRQMNPFLLRREIIQQRAAADV
jgi:hypothetical protein